MSYILKKSVHNYVQALAASAAATALIPGALMAQESESSGEQLKLEEIVVTGTLIRGVEPVGSQNIGLDRENIIETGAVTTNELLATVPQITNFFNQRTDQDPRGADRNSLNRPNLRNLPGINSASGATTLMLVDGHRLAPMGVEQSSLDADVVPGRVIERLDIVPDGGSSLYGADAVGGVINFVTLREYEGVEVDVGYDTGDDFDGWQASILGGTKWDSGSGYLFLGTTDRDNVKNNDRDWGNVGIWEEQEDGKYQLTDSGTECETPVGAVTSWFWYGAGWTDNPLAPGAGVTPVGDACDIQGERSLSPKQTRDNVFGAIVQEITDGITLDTKAYYMKRDTKISGYPLGDTVAEPSPTALGLVGENVGDLYDTAQVGVSYGVNPGYSYRDQKVTIETYGISPELIVDLPADWQLRNTFHYGRSDNESVNPGSDRAKMLQYVEDGQLDPLNVAAADPAVVADITDWADQRKSKQELYLVRAIADGAVFELPAGPLRAALGAEYAQEDAQKRSGEAAYNDIGAYHKANRDVKSAFGELSIPVFASLDLSISIRYDDYSDFGDATNPNYGFNWNPTDWLRIYGKYGESFNAPTLLDTLGTAVGQYDVGTISIVPDPRGEVTDPNKTDTFLLEGSSGSLLPQTADVWAVGFDLMPLDGLSFNVNYYEIDFEDLLGAVNPQSESAVLLNPDKFIFNPTQEELDFYISEVSNPEQFVGLDATTIGVITDRRQANTDSAKLKGYDFGIQYYHDTRFGSFGYGLSGNYQDSFDLTQNGIERDNLENNPDLNGSAYVSWYRNNWRAKVTVNYTDEYDADGTAINQDEIDSFTNTLLFVGYDFDSNSGITEGLSLRLNVDNVFDEDPPWYRRDQSINYSANGYSIGRVFKMGLTKRF